MTCVEYPEDFQRQVVAKWEARVVVPPKPKTSKTGRKSTVAMGTTKAAPGDVKKSESGDEEDDVVELVDSDESDDEELSYTPRGTRSRPTA